MTTASSTSVVSDQMAIHMAIASACRNWQIPRTSAFRSLADVVMDWSIIFMATWTACRMGGWVTMLAIFAVGNRQRALSNLLHEAAHQNLSIRRNVNDQIAQLLLAPALFNCLAFYRQQHARHHAWLGHPNRDPDFLPCVTCPGDHWFHVYARILLSPSMWAGSAFGHLAGNRLAWQQRLLIVLWWSACEALLAAIENTHFALLFLGLWMIARATVFHAITTFREMTDHYGLAQGGIFQYTREIPDCGLISPLIHPHHNGYHLTHHLLPHIPYCHLHTVHSYLRQIPLFNQRAIVCDGYLNGTRTSVEGWGARHA